MLDHLRQRVIDLLEPTNAVTLSTYGPAGIQAQVLSSIAQGLSLFVLVPATSEHLYNIEQQHIVVATTAEWQLRGYGRQLSPPEIPATVLPLSSIQSGDYAVVEIRPLRLEIGSPNGGGFTETIDFDDPLSAFAEFQDQPIWC